MLQQWTFRGVFDRSKVHFSWTKKPQNHRSDERFRVHTWQFCIVNTVQMNLNERINTDPKRTAELSSLDTCDLHMHNWCQRKKPPQHAESAVLSWPWNALQPNDCKTRKRTTKYQIRSDPEQWDQQSKITSRWWQQTGHNVIQKKKTF